MTELFEHNGQFAMTDFDYILVGGGLQNGLIALALTQRNPDVSLALVERSDTLGGNHTWCFFGSDVPSGAHDWLAPLIVREWPAYEVVFPGHRRVVDQSYATVSAQRLARVVSDRLSAAPHCELITGVEARDIGARRVAMEDGTTLTGRLIVDARGPVRPAPGAPVGFQKFVGLEVELSKPTDLRLPVVMDASVRQLDGYRFMYVLPFAPDRLLVEDTYFSDTAALDQERLKRRIETYLDGRGLEVASVIREESGVLPMPWAGKTAFRLHGPLVGGYAGGWFHPGTGYSFPIAVRLADFLSSRAPESAIGAELGEMARDHERRASYARFLNRMLFTMWKPEMRWAIYERFFRLPDDVIHRFFALEMTRLDRIRILAGRPPRGISARAFLSSRS